MKIRFFFDYMSTGFWEYHRGGEMIEVPDYIPEHLKFAISLWLECFELQPSDKNPPKAWLKWYNKQGEYIVSELNKLGFDEFIYVES